MTEPQTGKPRHDEKARQDETAQADHEAQADETAQPDQTAGHSDGAHHEPPPAPAPAPEAAGAMAASEVPPVVAMTAEEERDWSLAAHVGSFLAAWVALGFLCPLIVLLAKGKQSAFVRQHALESLNFQLTALGAASIAALLVFVFIGLVLLPFIVIGYVALVVMAGIAAYRGESYRYPVSIRVFN